MAIEIVRVDGLLDPVHSDFFEHRQHTDGGRQLPALIGVAHQGYFVANCSAYIADAMRILAPVGLADFHLHPAPALVDQRLKIADQVLELEVEPAAIGVVGLDRIGRPSEQPPQRHSCTLSREIPQRDVEHAESHVDNTGPTNPVCRKPVEPLPCADDVLRRCSKERGRVVPVDDVA